MTTRDMGMKFDREESAHFSRIASHLGYDNLEEFFKAAMQMGLEKMTILYRQSVKQKANDVSGVVIGMIKNDN